MKISLSAIVDFLQKEDIDYTWEQIPEREFELASLFYPIKEGFYFYSSTDPLPATINASLILVPNDISEGPQEGNSYVFLKTADPKQVYYRLLADLFARKSNGKIAATAVVSENARLGKNVEIGDFCVIEECEIEDNVIIGSHSRIYSGTKIGADTVIESMSIIGTAGVAWAWNEDQSGKVMLPQMGGVVIGKECFLGASTVMARGSLNESSTIGNHTLISPGGRFGHGVQIGEFVHLANNVVIGGNVKIGDFSFVGSAAVFRPKVMVHKKTVIGAGAVVVKNTTAEGKTVMGCPGKETATKKAMSGMPAPKK